MQQSYQQLSQQQLRNLYTTTGTLLLLDIPDGIQFGIDNILWKVGHKFKGIKFIPFGCHIISYTLKEENNQFKINKFLHFDQSQTLQTQIIVLKWSFKYCMFLELKGAEAQGYREGVKNFHFDSYLGPYPEANLEFWKENTNYITRRVLQKLDPIEKIYKFEQEYQKIKQQKLEEVRIDIDEDDEEEIIQQQQNQYQQQEEGKAQIEDKGLESHEKGQKQANPQHSHINKKFQALSDTIYYSQIPRILSNDPSHISKINLNKTEVFIQVITKEWLQTYKNQPQVTKLKQNDIFGILGEIQYSFIYFLIGQDQESLEQWKKLVNLVVFSDGLFESAEMIMLKKEELSKESKLAQKLIESFEKISLEFIVVLYNQIKQFPADFFIDELSKSSFMENCLKRLQEYKDQEEGTISKKVKKRLLKLFKLLSNKFNYEPKIEDRSEYDQDGPTIVSNSESYF